MRNLKSWKKTWQVQEKTFLHLSRLISHSVTLQQSLALNCPLFLKQTSFFRQQFDTCLLRIQKNFFSLWVFTETLNDSIVFLVAFFFKIISLFLILCIWCSAFKSCEQFTSGDRVHLITNVHDKHVTVNTVRFMSSCPFHLSLRLSAAQSPHLYIACSVNNQ